MKLAAWAVAPLAAVTAVEPTRWYPLGYSVEAGSLCAGLLCCLAVRAWSSANSKSRRWTVDVPISVVTVLFTVAGIVTMDANLATACVLGTGFAGIGQGLIGMAKSQVLSAIRSGAQAMLKALAGAGTPPPAV